MHLNMYVLFLGLPKPCKQWENNYISLFCKGHFSNLHDPLLQLLQRLGKTQVICLQVE